MARYKITQSDILKIYDAAKQGFSDSDIARIIGISQTVFSRWLKKYKSVRIAYTEGKEIGGIGRKGGFKDYVYKNLSPECKKLWNRINQVDGRDGGKKKAILLLRNKPKRLRQNLFLYALTASNFNISSALKKLNIPASTYREWCQEPEFAQLIEEMEWHKKNFFEEALFKLVKKGNPNAVLFVNKTKNRDRGYGDKTMVDINVNGNINHQIVKIDTLNLPVEVKREILDAIRNTKMIESREISSDTVKQITDGKEVVYEQ